LDTFIHLTIGAALALIFLGSAKIRSTAQPELRLRADHVAVCRICTSLRPEAAVARDAYLIRTGCIDDPHQCD
jgi:hypothetical protein